MPLQVTNHLNVDTHLRPDLWPAMRMNLQTNEVIHTFQSTLCKTVTLALLVNTVTGEAESTPTNFILGYRGLEARSIN